MDLGQVAQVIDKIGVKILDQKGELRDIGTVVEEIGNKWDTLSKAQQNAVAIVMAGKRQYKIKLYLLTVMLIENLSKRRNSFYFKRTIPY